MTDPFKPFQEMMQKENLPEVCIDTFSYQYSRLREDQEGYIRESDIEVIEKLPQMEFLADRFFDLGKTVIKRTVVMKLNGGLGTGMGMECAKSLLPAKNNMNFLEISARQAKYDGMPFILMDSFATFSDCEEIMNRIFGIPKNIPRHFLQHKIPKVLKSDLSPAICSHNPELQWCPPGHGDIYTALVTSGMMELLLEKGYQYAFVSNADNLGATIEPAILGYMAENRIPFLMEVANREYEDRKGGHLTKDKKTKKFILRELAQCRKDELCYFQDNQKYRFFNTNNIWIDLAQLRQYLKENRYVMNLPLIRNEKHLDPRDRETAKIYQLETAMGAAISLFENAAAMVVPRRRFRPVKTTNDLFLLNSDIYALTDSYNLRRVDGGRKLPIVDLDPLYYRHIDQLQQRFPNGIPSMMRCGKLTVEGDITFEKDVRFMNEVHIKSSKPAKVLSGTVLSGMVELS